MFDFSSFFKFTINHKREQQLNNNQQNNLPSSLYLVLRSSNNNNKNTVASEYKQDLFPMTDPIYNTDLVAPANITENKGEPTIKVSTTTTTMADEKVAVIDDGISHHPSKKSRKNDDNCDDILVRDEKKEADNDEHDDDDDEMMNIRVPSGMIIHEDEEDDLHHVIIPQKPLDNLLKVDDEAILDCWNLSIASHEAASMILLEKDYRWKESIIDDPINDNDNKQQNSKLVIDAKLLTLPSWAVDPFEMSKLNCE